MNTNRLQTIGNQLHEGANEAAQAARDAMQDAASTAKQAAGNATDSARDIYQTAKAKAGDLYDAARARTEGTYKDVRQQVDQTAERTGQYVKEHPMSSVLGAIAFGAGLGCAITLALRRSPEDILRRRYVEGPLDSVRDAVYSALEPVVKRLQSTCESTRDGAGKALDGVHNFKGSRAVESVSDHLRHLADNLKFW